MNCPSCISDYVIKNGFSKSGKQKYKCRDCGRQFVENPQNQINEEKKEMVDKLLGVEQHPRENLFERNRKKFRDFFLLDNELCKE